jgi:multimeric flavodoxin WrbA
MGKEATMKILAINGSARPEGTTTRLAQAALEGAVSAGAETEMILLAEKDIHFCANCLTCYQDIESRIGRCAIGDDMREILEKIAEADGILLASPVHSGFITGLMTTFFERAIWPLCRPTGEIMGMKGAPEPRLTDKTRASASIVSAGMTPPEMRKYCDMGTPFMREMAALMFNGEFVGDMFAAGLFPGQLQENQWTRALLLRELNNAQLKEAFDLGVTLAEAAKQGVKPYSPDIHAMETSG